MRATPHGAVYLHELPLPSLRNFLAQEGWESVSTFGKKYKGMSALKELARQRVEKRALRGQSDSCAHFTVPTPLSSLPPCVSCICAGVGNEARLPGPSDPRDGRVLRGERHRRVQDNDA